MPTSKTVWACKCGCTLKVEDYPYDRLAEDGSPICGCGEDYNLQEDNASLDQEALATARSFASDNPEGRKTVIRQLASLDFHSPAKGNAIAIATYIHLHFTLRNAPAASDFVHMVFDHVIE